jgi:hypothetical protein
MGSHIAEDSDEPVDWSEESDGVRLRMEETMRSAEGVFTMPDRGNFICCAQNGFSVTLWLPERIFRALGLSSLVWQRRLRSEPPPDSRPACLPRERCLPSRRYPPKTVTKKYSEA